jgi:hypothetical protein
MASDSPDAMETETGTEDIEDLLTQALALAHRVDKLPAGAMKEKLRAALAEIRVSAGDLASEARHED